MRVCGMPVPTVSVIFLSAKSRSQLPVILAVLTCGLSLLALFFWIPYAYGYGARPVSLFDNAIPLWLSFPEWTHGIAVIPLSALLLFLKRKELRFVPIRGSWIGLPLLMVSALTYWFGAVADLQYVGFLAIQSFIAGLILWFLGPSFFEALFFIWAFLLFAWPFVFLDQYLGFPLRLLASDASGQVLNFIGIPTLREGTAILSAPDVAAGLSTGQRFSVDVADPCSGLHSLFALTMVSALYGILTLRRWWRILVVILMALPLAIFGNLCRIVMLTIGTIQFGSAFAIGSFEKPTWFHEGAGILVYIAALAGVFVITSVLTKLRDPKPGSPRIKMSMRTGSFDSKRKPTDPTERTISIRRSLTVVALTVLTGSLVAVANRPWGNGDTGVDLHLPDVVDDYLGFDSSFEAERRLLPTGTEFAKKQYVSSSRSPVTCEIVLSGPQKSSIHRAQVCLVGQGWTVLRDEPVVLTLSDRRTQRIRFLTLSRVLDGTPIFGYYLYWFVGADRTTDDTFTRICLTSWDLFTRGVNHRWAYVMVDSLLAPDLDDSEEAKQALIKRLTKFAADIIPIIQKPESLANR
jgi:exosortase